MTIYFKHVLLSRIEVQVIPKNNNGEVRFEDIEELRTYIFNKNSIIDPSLLYKLNFGKEYIIEIEEFIINNKAEQRLLNVFEKI